MPPPTPAFAATGATVAGELGVALGSLYDLFRLLGDVVKNVLDPFHALRDTISDTARVIKDGIKTALDPFKDTLEDIGKAFGILGRFLNDTIGQALRVFGTAAANVVASTVAATQAVLVFGQQLAGFVRLASPGTFQIFMNTVDDFTAVLGQIFAPVLEALTPVVRAAADALKAFVPLGQALATMLKPVAEILSTFINIAATFLQPVVRVMEALAPSVAAITKLFAELFRAFEPIIKMLADLVSSMLEAFLKPITDAITAVMPILLAFARVFADVMKMLADRFRAMFGLGAERPSDAGSSVGAAAKGASVGTVSSVLEKTMLSAYSLGSAAASPMDRVAEAAKKIADQADLIYKMICTFPGMWEKITAAFLKVINPVPDFGFGFGSRSGG